MYAAFDDPYCYPGTDVLVNSMDLRDPAELEAFEEEMVRTRADEPLPRGRLTARHFRAVHRHLFQDVYGWAGEIRTVRISKGGNPFCYPEYIAPQLKSLFAWLRDRDCLRGLEQDAFCAAAAHFLSELNVIHAFRDGNGRAQLAFMAEIARRAGHPLDLALIEPDGFLHAMIASYHGDTKPLTDTLASLIRR